MPAMIACRGKASLYILYTESSLLDASCPASRLLILLQETQYELPGECYIT